MRSIARRFREALGGSEGPRPPLSVLVLGHQVRLPRVDGVTYVDDPEAGFDAVAAVSGVSRQELYRTLQKGRRLLAPVMDFGANLGARGDHATESPRAAAIEKAVYAIRPLVERIAEVADFFDSPDRDGLLALALAYTRECGIEAEWDPQHPQAVCYSMLAGIANSRGLLEPLAEMGLLTRRFYDRVTVCPRCGSSRLSAEERCPACKGINLAESTGGGPGGSGPGAPKKAMTCRSCGTTVTEPLVTYTCPDCGRSAPEDAIDTVDWFHYDLTEDGGTAVLSGRLPMVRLEEILKPFSQAYSARDFVMLVDHGLKSAVRYKRPFSMIDIRLANADELRGSLGSNNASEAFATLVGIIVDMLRTSDLVAARSNRIVLALPETKTTQAGVIMWRLKTRVTNAIRVRLHLECKVTQGEKGLDLLRSLQ